MSIRKSNVTSKDILSAVPATPPKKQLEGGGGRPPKEPESPVRREKEISELKALVTRLTKNNQEMLGLLTERVRNQLNTCCNAVLCRDCNLTVKSLTVVYGLVK